MALVASEIEKSIKDEIMSATQQEVERQCGSGGKKLIKELKDIGFSNIADFVEIDTFGIVRAKSLDEISRSKARLIKKIREKRVIKSTAEGDQVLDSTFEFELHDKIASIIELIRLGGYRAAERKELTGPGGGPIDVAVRNQVAKQLLDEVDGATRGVPGRGDNKSAQG